MTKLFYAASTAALLSVAATLPAMAQSSATGMSMPMITCRDITTMDREMARGVVFYVSGFQAGSGSMQNQASAAGAAGTPDTTADATGTAGSTADATGTAGSTADAGAGTDATGSTSTAGSQDTASGASAGASSAVMAQLPGFSQIDIDRVMADCANTPDRQLSEVLGMGATGTNQ